MPDEEGAGYDDAGDAGVEVPPAPWEYDGGGGGGGSSGFGDDGGTDSSGTGGSSGFGDGDQDETASSGYPGMNSGLPPDNAGINYPIDYSPPPGMGTDTDMGNPYEPIPPGTFGSLGSPTPPQRGGGGGSSYPRGPSIPPDVLRQFINLLRYGGVQRI